MKKKLVYDKTLFKKISQSDHVIQNIKEMGAFLFPKEAKS